MDKFNKLARLLGAIRAWFANRKAVKAALKEKERFKYVATLQQGTRWEDAGYTSWAYYLLYENGYGKRRFDYTCESSLLKNVAKTTDLYARVVQPWVDGHYSSNQVIDLAKRQVDQRHKT